MAFYNFFYSCRFQAATRRRPNLMRAPIVGELKFLVPLEKSCCSKILELEVTFDLTQPDLTTLSKAMFSIALRLRRAVRATKSNV